MNSLIVKEIGRILIALENRKENWLNINSDTRVHYKESINRCTLIKTWSENSFANILEILGKKANNQINSCIDDTIEIFI